MFSETTSIRLRTPMFSAHDHDEDQFWNVPFGALRDAGEFGSSEDLVAFWREGRALLLGV